MNCSLPGSSVHGISQAKILKWVTISFSRWSSQPRDWTCVSCIVGRFFTTEPLGEPFYVCVCVFVCVCNLFFNCIGFCHTKMQFSHNSGSFPSLLPSPSPPPLDHYREPDWAPSVYLREHLPLAIYLTNGSVYIQRRQWQPTPVLLPGKFHGWRSLVGCSPWGREELDTTEWYLFPFSLSCIGEGNGNPLQCYCLENPRDGGAWWAAIYGVAQSRTWLSDLAAAAAAAVYTTWCYSLHLSHSFFPPLCPQACSLHLHLHFFPANRFINTILYIYTMEYYSAIKKNEFESVLVRLMNLEPLYRVK